MMSQSHLLALLPARSVCRKTTHPDMSLHIYDPHSDNTCNYYLPESRQRYLFRREKGFFIVLRLNFTRTSDIYSIYKVYRKEWAVGSLVHITSLSSLMDY